MNWEKYYSRQPFMVNPNGLGRGIGKDILVGEKKRLTE
jgi:hypothetical protein